MANPSSQSQPLELPEARKAAENLWRDEVRGFCGRIGVPERFEEVVSGLAGTRAFRRLFGEWDRLPFRQRRKRWQELAEVTQRAAYATRPFCLRCGECCRRQTPGLHAEDLGLVREGVIGPQQLLTLRRGERAWSARRSEVIVLQREMVKLRPLPSGACPNFQPEDISCAIYDRRPLECRALKCWQPGEFAAATRSPHLRRRDVLPAGPLAELAGRQEAEIDSRLPSGLVQKGDLARVVGLVDLDDRLRQEALAAGVPEAELDFLLGRPLRESLSDLLPK